MTMTTPPHAAPRGPKRITTHTQKLRTRELGYETKQEQKRVQRPRKHPPFCLMPHLEVSLPYLAAHLESHNNYPPNTARSSAAAVKVIHGMHAQHGLLVFMRFSVPDLNRYELHDAELTKGAKKALKQCFKPLLEKGQRVPYLAAFQQGQGQDNAHIHAVLPLAALKGPYQERLDRAPHGAGGGIEIAELAAHGVVIKPTKRDFERVGAYIRRHPDARLQHPHTFGYLEALEDEAERKALGVRLVRTGWDGGGARGLSTK